MSLETVPEDVALLARGFETAFIQYAKANALKAARQTYDTIHELSADKAAVVQEKNYNMVCLHQNKPTAITREQPDKLGMYAARVRFGVEKSGVSIEQCADIAVDSGLMPAEFKDQVVKMLKGETVE